jgi:hypothetical protein
LGRGVVQLTAFGTFPDFQHLIHPDFGIYSVDEWQGKAARRFAGELSIDLQPAMARQTPRISLLL